MNYTEEDKLDLIHGLCKLFSEIDINGDKKMEWREFTQYIIDEVIQDNIKPNSRGEMPNQKEMLEIAHSKKFLRFGQNSYVDHVIHEGAIRRVIFYPSINRLMLVESQSHIIKFSSLELKRKEVIDLYEKNAEYIAKPINPEEGTKKVIDNNSKFFVMSASYSERDKIVFKLYCSLYLFVVTRQYKSLHSLVTISLR